MSESDEYLSSCASESEREAHETSSDKELVEAGGIFEPYQDEPEVDKRMEESSDEEDEDGLAPVVLESRFEGEITVDMW